MYSSLRNFEMPSTKINLHLFTSLTPVCTSMRNFQITNDGIAGKFPNLLLCSEGCLVYTNCTFTGVSLDTTFGCENPFCLSFFLFCFQYVQNSISIICTWYTWYVRPLTIRKYTNEKKKSFTEYSISIHFHYTSK